MVMTSCQGCRFQLSEEPLHLLNTQGHEQVGQSQKPQDKVSLKTRSIYVICFVFPTLFAIETIYKAGIASEVIVFFVILCLPWIVHTPQRRSCNKACVDGSFVSNRRKPGRKKC